MSEQDKPSWFISLSKALEAFAHTPFPYFLGIALMLALPKVADKWDGHIFPMNQKNCYQLQELKGKVYIINTCTGEAKLYLGPELSKGTNLTPTPNAK